MSPLEVWVYLECDLAHKEKPVLQLWRNCFIYSSGTFYLHTNHLHFSIVRLRSVHQSHGFLSDLAQLFAYSWPLGFWRVVHQLLLLQSAKFNKALINTKPAFNDLAFNLILNNLQLFSILPHLETNKTANTDAFQFFHIPNRQKEEVGGLLASMNSTYGLLVVYRNHLQAKWACEKAYE